MRNYTIYSYGAIYKTCKKKVDEAVFLAIIIMITVINIINGSATGPPLVILTNCTNDPLMKLSHSINSKVKDVTKNGE